MSGDDNARFPLNQADWRFLLPSRQRRFDHLLLLGGTPGMADLVGHLGLARRISTRLSDAEPADAVIMLAKARESLNAAVQRIAVNGVLYCEIDRRRLRCFGLTPRRVGRLLRTRGVQPTATYCVAPGFASPDTYLPADNAAVRWYVDALYRSRTKARRALKGALQACAWSGVPLPALAPRFAVTAVRGASASVPAVVDCARAALGWNDRSLRAALLAHGEAESNRMCALLFEADATRPAAVAKFPRQPRFNAAMTSEHASLTAIRAALEPPLRDSVPASSLTECHGLSVAVQSYLPGATLRSRAGGSHPELVDDLNLVTNWLARFHRSTTMGAPPAREWLTRRLVNGLCADYEARFGLTDAERALFGEVAAQTHALDRMRLPLVWQHTDFGPWNIHRGGAHISVIDWELARHGPPLVDLLFFAMDWNAEAAQAVTRLERAARFEALFCDGHESGPLSGPIRAAIATYLQQVNLPRPLLQPLLVYMVLERALLHVTRFPAASATPSTARDGNRHVDSLEILARRVSAVPERYRAA